VQTPEWVTNEPQWVKHGPLVSICVKEEAVPQVQEKVSIILRSSLIAAPALMLVILASCATTRGHMMTLAGRLELRADAFASDTGGYFRDAPEFADQAHDFRETVDRAGDREVILAYEQLWRTYQALRHEVERSDSRQAQVDLKSVTQAFGDVVRDIRGYADADSALYARGGYQHDPYYDP
jgi:hypothetical protein